MVPQHPYTFVALVKLVSSSGLNQLNYPAGPRTYNQLTGLVKFKIYFIDQVK